MNVSKINYFVIATKGIFNSKMRITEFSKITFQF